MATDPTRTGGSGVGATSGGLATRARRRATETKQALKTTEFWTMVVLVVAILISAAAISGGDTASGGDAATDEFTARQAWLYVAILGSAYMISRGLAKSGSREPYTDDDH